MSPIPNFDHNNVIPPHLGNPTQPKHLSPYECTIIELCQRFATSKQRVVILKGLLSFRTKMTQAGVINGFQWLDGSFTENIEVSEGRPPGDLDLITFYKGTINVANFPEFSNPSLSKLNFCLDHYPVDYAYSPELTVELTRYWIQLFTHNRHRIWKGILRLPINTPIEDHQSLQYLNSISI